MVPPAFDDDFGLTQRVEDFTGQQLVSHSPVEAFAISALPWRSRLDVSRLGPNGFDPVSHGLSNEFRAVAPKEGIEGSCRDSGARSFSLQARTGRGGHGQSKFL